ncbi:MAG: D-alanine--D-alanine ligase [Candidatus Kapabacteria bacterium]|jgi:D-alanine-D-alanine ligase|nr:D-alanine--D-alanine ligase [Candidatus Kapabacteria bacterium]
MMNIAVVLGGISPERNISLLSGRAVVKALRSRGHTVVAVDPSLGTNCIVDDAFLQAATAAPVSDAELAAFSPRLLVDSIMSPAFDGIDVVFIALHGRYGEDGYVQSLLDLRGLRYTGSSMLASAVAMDKATTKLLFATAGIPTPHWVTVAPGQAADGDLLESIRKELPGSLVVKPNDQGSTVGMTIVDDLSLDALADAIRLAGRFSEIVLIETFIPGRELTVAVLDNEALPIVEIAPKAGFYDYENKYTKGNTEYHCPAELSDDLRDYIHNLATAAHGVVGCRAYSRVDFRLTPEGQAFCLEVNTIPGCTETSLVPMAARAAGMEFDELCEEIIRLSLA